VIRPRLHLRHRRSHDGMGEAERGGLSRWIQYFVLVGPLVECASPSKEHPIQPAGVLGRFPGKLFEYWRWS
jgi:hypothetical protein